ncbi:MAG: acyl-CoA thioesterase [Clostridia bacterium]
MNEKIKKAADSHTVMSEIVLLSSTNGSGRLFGGQIMSWMDIAGAICAKRHSGCEVVTVSVDHLSFLKPAMPNDVVVLTADLVSVGNTSMKIKITAEIEPLGTGDTSERLLTSEAYFTYVAIGPDGRKSIVPRLGQ